MKTTKICPSCKIEKDTSYFSKNKNKSNGLNSKCKQCTRLYDIQRKNKRLGSEGPHPRKQRKIKHKRVNGVRVRVRTDRDRELARIRYANNREAMVKINGKKKRKKLDNDPVYRLRCNVSRNVNSQLKRVGSSKGGKSSIGNLPYTAEELMKHLETQFDWWMNRYNQGNYRLNEWDDEDPSTWRWQLDHKIPHSNFKYTSLDDELYKQCWALSNLRPLSAKQNVLDGDRREKLSSSIIEDDGIVETNETSKLNETG